MTLVGTLITIGLALFVLLTAAAYSVYAERRVAAFIQQRVGPNRVGPWGLLQPLADVIKLILKEDIVPDQADRTIHFLAPVISAVIAFTAYAVNDVVMVAYQNGKIWFGKNGTWMNSGNPVAGTGNVFTTLPTSPVAGSWCSR